MTKKQADEILNFIKRHYDCVGQEDYFELCDMLLETIVSDANKQGYGARLAKDHPQFFLTSVKIG